MNKRSISHRDQVHALFVKHSPLVRGYILSLMPNMSRADDVLQETFLTVSAKAEDFDLGTNFVTWACSVARFKVLEESRAAGKSARMLSPEAIEAVCAAEPDLMDDDHDDCLLALQECVSALSPHTRRAVELRYARAHSAPEIAKVLGWSTGSVYTVLSRARHSLQECVHGRLEAKGQSV